MNNTAAATGVAPAPKNLLARFIGVIISPKETFQSIVATPRWLGMLALTSLLVAGFSALPMTTDAGKQAAIDQQVEQRRTFGMETSAEAYAQMEKMSGIMPYITFGTVLVFSPVVAVIIAGILFAIFNAALGGEASFKQVFTVLIHAGAVSALSTVFSGIVNYFRGGVGSAANLGALLPMLPEDSFVANLLGAVDVFLVWYVIVLAIGLGVLYKRRTQPIAMSLLAVYAVIAFVIAIVKSRVGGA
jgi:Yip1 domain